jgi:hypothetical protein
VFVCSIKGEVSCVGRPPAEHPDSCGLIICDSGSRISLSQLLFLCLEARQLSQITQPMTAPNRNRCIMASGSQSPDHTPFTLWISVMSPALANG